MAVQSNVQQGDIVLVSNVALTDKECYLVKILDNAGVAEFGLPTAVTDLALFVVTDGKAITELSSAQPLMPDKSVRVVLKGACVAGDVLVLAAIAGSDAGKVRILPGAGGTYRGIGIAEETGVDGQEVKMRPAMIGNITV